MHRIIITGALLMHKWSKVNQNVTHALSAYHCCSIGGTNGPIQFEISQIITCTNGPKQPEIL